MSLLNHIWRKPANKHDEQPPTLLERLHRYVLLDVSHFRTCDFCLYEQMKCDCVKLALFGDTVCVCPKEDFDRTFKAVKNIIKTNEQP